MVYSSRSVFWAVFLAFALALAQVSPAYAAALPAEINQQFTPLQIDAGGVSKLRISIYNPNTFALSSVSFTNTFPTGLYFATPANVTLSPSCGSPTITPSGTGTLADPAKLTFAGGAVPAQTTVPGECWVEVDVSSVTEGNLINTIPVNALNAEGTDTAPDPDVVYSDIRNTSPASATITVIAVEPPSMSKGFAPNTIYVGGVSQLTIRINNNDSDTNLTNVSFTDNLPSVTTPIAGQVRLANPVSATTTGCGAGASLTANPGGTSIAFSGGTITPAVDCVIRVNVTGDGGEYTNVIPAGPAGPGSLRTQQGVTNEDDVEADLNIQPVDIAKAFSPATIVAGDTTVLTITLENPTDADYTGASLTDIIPAGLTVQASPVPSTTCGAGIVTVPPARDRVVMAGGTIPARVPPATQGTCTITATVQANLNASGRLVNTIAPGDFRANGGLVTNVSLVTANLDVTPALDVEKQFAAPYAMARGGLNLVTVTLYNNSSVPLVNARFSDDLPSGLRVADLLTSPSAPDPVTTCGGTVTHDTDTVSLAGGTIPASGSCTVTFSVTNTTAGGGTFDNTIDDATIQACDRLAGPPTPICIGVGGDVSTPRDLIVVPADQLPVDVAKAFSPDSTTGSVSTLTITLTAPLDIGINGIDLTDNLPAGMTVATTPNASETCPAGTLAASPGSNQVIFTNLNTDPLLAAGTSCQIRVDVTADPGIYLNEILAGTITTAQGRANELAVARDTLNVTSLTMRKAFYPTMVQDGGKSTLTITLENGSTSALTNVNLLDNFLPPDSQGTATNGIFIFPGTETTTCRIDSGYPVPTLTVAPDNRSISMSGGSIKAISGGVNGICTITVDVVGETTGSYRNTIPMGNVDATVATTGKVIEPLTDASATLQVRDLDIGIVKGFNPVLVYGGATSTMTIRLINPNATALTGIKFVDDMDFFYYDGTPPDDEKSGIILATPTDFDTGTCGGTLTALSTSSFRFQNGILPPNFSCEMTLKVIMEQNGSRTNKIPVGAVTTFNGVTSDQPAQASLTNLPGIRVVKVFNPNPVTINEVSTLTLTISNTSNVPVREMDLLDQFPNLPTGLIIKNDVADPLDDPTHTCIDPAAPIPSPATSLTATGGSQLIQLENGSLAGKGDPSGKDVCTIIVKVVATSAGAFENIIPVGGVTGRDGEKNLNPGSDTLYVGSLYSLGNRVWFDTNNNGAIDTNEVGVDGVTVELYNADASGNPILTELRDTDVTYQGGYYRFDKLEPRANGYVVVIPASQFAPGGKLAGYWSSGSSTNASGVLSDGTTTDPDLGPDGLPGTLDDDRDSDENGITQTGGSFIGAVISKAVTLGLPASGGEPTNDDDAPLVSPFGEAADDYSNRTVDFGFYRTSLGNLVYLDKDGNGTYGGSPDVSIPGATVELFASDGSTEINVGPDGVWKTADDSGAGVLTDADGDYLFSGLPAGSYVVKVTPPAAGGYSSTIDSYNQTDNDNPNTNANNNDNGDGTASGQVSSAPILLTPGSSGALNQNTITQATGTTHNPTMDFGFLLYSLGNRVWFDTDNDGSIDVGTEVGVGGVRVQLFNSGGTEILVGADGVLGTLDDSTGGMFTNSTGHYRFDNLPAGDYVVRVSNSNFMTGALRSYWSSGTTMTGLGDLSDSTITDPDNDVDSDENGITTFADGTPSITDVNPINYVSSAPITLGGATPEPSGETDLSGGQGTIDNHANMTADFGFYRTAIGDLVFVNGSTTDDGDYDAGTDGPLAGATVTLYASNGSTQIPTGLDGILGTSDDGSTGITTPATGIYSFSGLPAGDYVVKVTPPAGYSSLVDNYTVPMGNDNTDPDNNLDNNDNGVGTGATANSNVLTMNPTTETPSASLTRTDATGTTTDTSVDFGFISPNYSLGNRVWYDTDNNGAINGAEAGVNGVRVELYVDTNGNGVYNPGVDLAPVLGAGFPTAVNTDASGYYRFDGLPAGEYIVVIANDNFTAGGNTSLVGYWSSGTTRADNGVITDSIANASNSDADSDDNGATTFSGAGAAMIVNYVSSSAVTIGPGLSEPTGENDPAAPFWQGTSDDRANMTLDFGFYRTTISNQIFVDSNGSGLYNGGVGGDLRLQNMVVELLTGDGSTVISSVTTPANGTYSFSPPQGDYFIRVTPPAGFTYSSMTDTVNTADPDTHVDNDDNGIGTTGGTAATLSGELTMTPGEFGASATGTTADVTVDFGYVSMRFSLGNRVWFDTDNDSAIDAGELGVNGVRVLLYSDDGDNVFDAGDTYLSFDDTDASGYYRFDNLLAGDYLTVVPGDNFRVVTTGDAVPGDPLEGYWSSGTTAANDGTVSDNTNLVTSDPDTDFDDSDDNGVTTFAANAVDYVASAVVTLGPGNNEPIIDNDPVTNPEVGEAANAQSNRTLDFGFYKTAIGNLVFQDSDGSGHNNAGDTAIAGALVHLYRGDNSAEIITGADGIPNTADDTWGPDGAVGGGDDGTGGIRTDASGNYLFSGLPAGDYIVKVDAPTGMLSTVDVSASLPSSQADNDNPDTNVDNNDNGDGEGLGTITSDITNRLTTNPGSTGANGINLVDLTRGATTDNTVDFGFVYAYSLGNRVWYDTNNDGVLNLATGEIGIPNVRVELFRDTNNDNTPDGVSIGNATTDASGYYRFDNLRPGNYIVTIPADNFRNVGVGDTVAGDPLRGYWSTGTSLNSVTGAVVESATNDPDPLTENDAYDNAASDENGRTVFSGSSIDYVIANAVTLGADAEPLLETNVSATGQGAVDNRANMTVDFGFYRVEIGNLVFWDNNVNGTFDAGDTPIDTVVVRLYDDNNHEIPVGPDGILGTTDDATGGVVTGPLAVIHPTWGAGEYHFSSLPEGNYVVRVETPTDSISTIDNGSPAMLADNTTPDNHLDDNDNGVGVGAGTISANVLNMNAGEFVASASGITTDNTVDFGFTAQVAIGNRIWFDTGAGAAYNNGILDGGEAGVPNGVTVELRRASDDSLVATTTTTNVGANLGYYQFDNLYPNTYYVQIPASMFDATLPSPLLGYVSSLGGGLANDDDDQTADENGIDGTTANPLTTAGIRTPNYVLETNTEPSAAPAATVDDDTGYTGTLADVNVNFTADFGFTQLVAIGNRLWYDDGAGTPANANNGRLDTGELGVADGVTVQLYRQGDPIGTPFRTTATATVGGDYGYYQFDNLNPGNYFVHIPASMFDATAPSPLQGFHSSTGAGTDPLANEGTDENGIDVADLAANGISSRIYTLTPNSAVLMPMLEDQTGYSGYLDDDNVNFTADFGFYNIAAIGNRIWLDTGAGVGTANDGIQNGSEPGVNGVRVELYRDTNGNNGYDAGIDQHPATNWFTTTADDTLGNPGYYVFDNLLAGVYFIHIPASNFAVGQPLEGYYSSEGNGADETSDQGADENGIDQPTPATTGITSTPFNLSANVEPSVAIPPNDVGDDDADPTPLYTGVLDDDDVNFTADFGFVQKYALGNRVWLDTNDNAVMDTGEVGVNGVQVQLYRASGGNPTGSALATDITANGGYYLFDNIFPGEYVVVITADNFIEDGTNDNLVGYWSSLTTMDTAGAPTEDPLVTPDPDANGADGIPNTADDDIDLDDNGTRTTLAGFTGTVISKPVTIGPNGNTEPTTNETDKESGVGDGSQPDGRSNLKVDFGFYKVSVGNLVFSDGNKNGSYLAADDAGLADVLVHLFASNGIDEIITGADGILGTEDDTWGPDGIFGGTSTDDGDGGMYTDANGEYKFDGLPRGTYIIRVDSPVGVSSTIDNGSIAMQDDNDDPNDNLNNNDNGDDGTIIGIVVSSNPVTLTPGTDLATRPNNIVTNVNGNTHNPTVDFGFVPAFSLGNRVWFDTNNNGIIDLAEVGINGVTVALYHTDASGNPTTPVTNSGGTPLTDITHQDTTVGGKAGYYLFNPLPAGNYVVVIIAANFNSGAVLEGYWSSGVIRANNGSISEVASPDPDNDVDTNLDENGMHRLGDGDVVSKPVTLGPNPTEPTADNDLDLSLIDPDHQGQPDNRGNMTVDFGFYTMSLGNLVWEDLDNSGTVNGAETGFNDVDVQLWSADGLTMLDSTITIGNGDFTFVGLPQGNYLIRIPNTEFEGAGTLVNYASSTGTNSIVSPVALGSNEPAPDPDDILHQIDNDDNGSEKGGTLGVGGYIQSEIITMSPIGEASYSDADGSTSEPRVDFGVFRQDDHDPLIGIAKNLVSSAKVSPGTYQVIYDIFVENMGDTPLDSVNVTENLSATFTPPTISSVVSVSAVGLTVNPTYNGSGNLLSGTDTLAVGTSGTIRLTVNVIPYAAGPFNNTAIASGINPFGGATVTDQSQDEDTLNPDPDSDGDPTNNNEPTPITFGPGLFDPPIGIKVFNDSGLPQLEWTMTWINSTNIAAVNARVSDPIPAGTTYVASGATSGYAVPGTAPAGSTNVGVSCTSPSAATTTTLCYYEGPTTTDPLGRIVWEGVLGPDFGHTTANTAVNELLITFRVEVPLGVNAIYNLATIDTDLDGNGIYDANEIVVADSQAIWVRQNRDGGLTDRERRAATSLPTTGFAPNMVTALPEQPANMSYFEAGGIQIEIPKLGVNTSVTGIPQAQDGSWDVTWLWNQTGWLQGTAYPTTVGNSAITGHVYLPNGEPGIFVNVHKLAYGDKIILHAYGQKYTYEVRENKQVKPNDVSVLNRKDEAWVTLITCQGYNESSNTYASRVAVKAVLLNVETEKTTSPADKER